MLKAAASKIAHNTFTAIYGPGESRMLQDLIIAEKAVATSIQRLSADLQKSAEALRAWGIDEAGDLGDVLSASLDLMNLFTTALSRYATHEHTVREHMKAIRSREEQFAKLQRFQQSMVDKEEITSRRLERLRAENKSVQEINQQQARLRQLREAMQFAESKIRSEGAEMRNFKRKATKRWMSVKFGGLVECSQVGTIVGQVGKLVVAELPDMQPGQGQKPYTGYTAVEALVRKAQRRVNKVKYSPLPMTNFLTQLSSPQPGPPHRRTPSDSNIPNGTSADDTQPPWSFKPSLLTDRDHLENENQRGQVQAVVPYQPNFNARGRSNSYDRFGTPGAPISPIVMSPTADPPRLSSNPGNQSRLHMREYLTPPTNYGGSPTPPHRVIGPQLPTQGSWVPGESFGEVDLNLFDDFRVPILTPPPTYENAHMPELSNPSLQVEPSVGDFAVMHSGTSTPRSYTVPGQGHHLTSPYAVSRPLAPAPEPDAGSDTASTQLPYLSADGTDAGQVQQKGKRVRFSEVDDVREFTTLSPVAEGVDDMAPTEPVASLEQHRIEMGT